MTLQAHQGNDVEHGGNLARASALFPHAPQPWIDLSTGINPHSYPLFDLPSTALTRLPEPARLHELKTIAARAYGAPSAHNVAAAPGTQILLPRIVAKVKPGRALILGPTYAEHLRAATIAGHAASDTIDFADLFSADVAVVVNPNNPDGRIVDRDNLLALAGHMRVRGGLLVVDEAFMDVGPRGQSLAADVGAGGLVVLRSFGKFYGLAGLRLGFAITSQVMAGQLEAELGPWAIAGPALEYGLTALSDTTWQSMTRQRLATEASALDSLLERHALDVQGGTSLFRFVQHPDAEGVFTALGGQGILVRRFAGRPDVLRIGLPAGAAEHARLDAALAKWAARVTSSDTQTAVA